MSTRDAHHPVGAVKMGVRLSGMAWSDRGAMYIPDPVLLVVLVVDCHAAWGLQQDGGLQTRRRSKCFGQQGWTLASNQPAPTTSKLHCRLALTATPEKIYLFSK